LARQLLHFTGDLAAVADILYGDTPTLDVEGVVDVLERMISSNCKMFIVLDGIDECDHAQRRILLPELCKLQQRFSLFLCVSLRLELDNHSKTSSGDFFVSTNISIPDDNPDIESYIDTELAACIELGSLRIGEPALVLDIRNALVNKAQGMFLWVALQIVSLCSMQTDQAIRKALLELPKDLPETFSRILLASRGVDSSSQKRILGLISVAERPLTAYELREALSVVPGNTNWDAESMINDIYSTLACCGSLLTIDEKDSSIQLSTTVYASTFSNM
jgi:hypothetical protein